MANAIVSLALEGLREKGKTDARALAALATTNEADGTYLIDHETAIPTWRQRTYNTEETPLGKPYKWNGQVYQLWQQHDATEQPDWSPDKAVALWNICHTTNPKRAKAYTAPEGTRGLWQVDECCIQSGHVWRSLTADNAYSPAELTANWEDLGLAEEVQA